MQSHQQQQQEAAAAEETSSSSSNQKTFTQSAAAVRLQPDINRDDVDGRGWLRLGLVAPDHQPSTSTSGTDNYYPRQAEQDFLPPDPAGRASITNTTTSFRQITPTPPPPSLVPSTFVSTTTVHAPAPPPSLQLMTHNYNVAAAPLSFPLVIFHQSTQQQTSTTQQAHYWPFGPTVNPQQILIPSTTAGGPPTPEPFLLGLGPPVVAAPAAGDPGAGSSSTSFPDVRFVLDRPRRPHAGIWFRLLASLNQAREPFLPQVAKSYLRIKDGRMTVGLLMKYLVNKLSCLDNESQVEITCRGQPLAPSLSLQHVRDHIWRYSTISTDAQPQPQPRPRPDEIVTLLPDSSTADHLMVLHYGRSPLSS